MLIYIFIPWFLPAYKAGGPIQSIANLVDQYQDASYRIFTSNTDFNDTPLHVVPNTWLRFNKRTEVYYASKSNQSIKVMRFQVKISSPDKFFIIGVFDIYFNLLPLVLFKKNKIIISTRGMLHPNGLAQKSLKKRLFIDLLKVLQIPAKCSFHATNEEEEQNIRDAFGSKVRKVFVASNFPGKIVQQSMPQKMRGSLVLSSIALISPMKNHLLILEALRQMPQHIFYHIYGPVKNKSYWKECQEIIELMPDNIKVTFHGELPPAGVPVALRNCHVFILPSESENFGHALVEALSAGRPVITSHNVPWTMLQQHSAGINVDPNHATELRDAIAFFAALDLKELEAWGEGAYNYGRGVLDVEGIANSYAEMFSAAG